MRAAISLAVSMAIALSVVSSASAQPFTAGERARAARDRLEEGIHQLSVGEPEAALESLRASYRLRPSSRTRLYISRTLARLGRAGECYAELGQTVAEAEDELDSLEEDDPRIVAVIEAAERERGAVESRIAWLSLDVVAPVVPIIVIDGRSIDPEDIGERVPVTPGEVEVDVTCTSCEALATSFEIGVGEHRRLQLTLDEAVVDLGPDVDEGIDVRSVFGWSSAGIGAVAAVGWIALITMSEQKRGDGDLASADDLQTASYISLAGAGVTLAVGLALLLWEALDEGDRD